MNKLRGKIKEVCGSESRFAELMGMTRAAMSYKLNGKRQFSLKQIVKACEILGIDINDAPTFFLQ